MTPSSMVRTHASPAVGVPLSVAVVVVAVPASTVTDPAVPPGRAISNVVVNASAVLTIIRMSPSAVAVKPAAALALISSARAMATSAADSPPRAVNVCVLVVVPS